MLQPSTKKRKYASRASGVQSIEDDDDSLLQPLSQKRKYTRRVSKPVVSDEAVDLELEEALRADPDDAQTPVVAKRKYKQRTSKAAALDAALEGEATPAAQANTRSARARVSEPIILGGGLPGHDFAGLGLHFQAVNSPVPAIAADLADAIPRSAQAPGRLVAPAIAPLPVHAPLQMPDAGLPFSAFQIYAQQAEAYSQGLQTIIQKRNGDLEASRSANEKQEQELAAAQAKILAFEQQIATLQLRPNPSLPEGDVIGGRIYTRDPSDSANPGLLRHEEDMEYDWGSKKWNRVITMRELDLVVDSDEDPVRYTIQDEDFQGSKLADGTTVMVRCEGRFVSVGGHQYWERIVYQEAKSPRR